jgi:uncharacterized membrane protein YcaP (DUF421 family)
MSDLLEVVWHTAAIYLFLIVMLRLVGKRQMGQLNAIDLIVVILLGSAVETSMVAANVSLPAGLVCATVLLLLNRALAYGLLHSRRWRHLVTGGPIVLVHKGHLVYENLKRSGLTENDVREALREREETRLRNIQTAILEPDGTVTVVPKDSSVLNAHPANKLNAKQLNTITEKIITPK